MKIPGRNDPSGDRESALPRDIVIAVLREHGVQVIKHGFGDFYELSQDEIIEFHPLNEMVGGLLVRGIAREFGIQTIAFYYDPLTGQRRYRPS